MLKQQLQETVRLLHDRVSRRSLKEKQELACWRRKKREVGDFGNGYYRWFYTELFGLDQSFYDGKRIVDIGCGPRGSLEWADNCARRVGLDPLANEYLQLGADAHKMTYVAGTVETAVAEFGESSFDVVCSFNSLDHVDNLSVAVAQIKHITAPNGLFLLIVDVHDSPTLCEPSPVSWGLPEQFAPEFQVVDKLELEKKGGGVYQSIEQRIAFAHDDSTSRYGILVAKLERRS